MTIITVTVTIDYRYLMNRKKARLWELFYDFRNALTMHEGRAPMEFMDPPKDASKDWLATNIMRMARRLPDGE